MESQVNVNHRQRLLQKSYLEFTTKLESLVNRLDPAYTRSVLDDPGALHSYLERLQGDTGLLLFDIQHHGDILNLVGKPRLAVEYVIGNPLIAVKMTRHDIRAALYTPLRMLVYEKPDHVAVAEYDIPSSLFGQFGNALIDRVAKSLDLKMLNLIMRSDGFVPPGFV